MPGNLPISSSSGLCIFLGLGLQLYSAASWAVSAPEECHAIIDDRVRLACYDELFAPPPAANNAAVVELAADDSDKSAPESPISRKRKFRYSLFDENFAVQPYHDSYLLPFSHVDHINLEPFIGADEGESDARQWKNEEVKFQISFKIPLAEDVLFRDATLWAAYTQQSMWQMYNSDASSPFRETNYEPELFWQLPTNLDMFGVFLDSVSIGINHQSNGRDQTLSRSWNRIITTAELSHNRWQFDLRAWYRLPESKDEDDNPDIDDYLGYGDFSASYHWHPDLALKTRLQHNFHNQTDRTSVVLSLVFPLPGPLNGYLEYFNGYGESLIDYDHRNKRIGLGVILNEWK